MKKIKNISINLPEMVINEAKERHALLSGGGKFIFGSSVGIPIEIPIDNIVCSY